MTIKRNCYQILLEDRFNDVIISSEKGYHLVAFNNEEYALNKVYDDILEEVANQFKEDMKCHRVDSSASKNLVSELGINSIPIVYIYKRGKVLKTLVGIYSKVYLTKTIAKIIKSR
ncbi:MAG: thioredoxin family protein [Bacteroidota bacterium]